MTPARERSASQDQPELSPRESFVWRYLSRLHKLSESEDHEELEALRARVSELEANLEAMKTVLEATEKAQGRQGLHAQLWRWAPIPDEGDGGDEQTEPALELLKRARAKLPERDQQLEKRLDDLRRLAAR